jgi:SGNH domain (fused to AT3 domains)
LLLALSVLLVVLILPKIAELSEKAPSIGTTAKAPHLATDLLTVSDTPISQTETDVLWQKKLEAALRLKVAPKSVVASLANLEDQKNTLFANCLDAADASVNGGCVVGSSSPHAKQAVIIGDSTALSIAPAVAGAVDLKSWRVHILTRHECPVADVTPIIAGKPDYECSRHRQIVFTRLASMHPDLIFMSEGSIADTVRPPGTSQLQFWASGYAKSLSRLNTFTPKVVAIFEPPLTPTAVGCVRSNGDLRTCFGQYSEDLAFLAYTKQITATHHVHLVVLSHWLCLDGFCPAIIDNTAVKFDTTHISIDMAKKLAPLLRGDLLKAGIIESKK